MSRAYIGIDPGAAGGMAVLYPDGSLDALSFGKVGYQAVRDRLEYENRKFRQVGTHPPFVLFEQVGGFMGAPKTGGGRFNPASSHTMFALGREAGIVEGLLIALGLECARKVPRSWQKLVLPFSRNGEDRTAWKNRLKAEAQRLFPNAKITLAVSDAILLAVAAKKLCEAGKPKARV